VVYSLDGEWLIACDPRNEGRGQDWWAAVRPEACLTNVPWIIQGVFPGYHGVAWYWRQFSVHRNRYPSGKYLLRFWAVDYLAEVWVNGQRVGAHEGAETPFVLDITEAVVPDGKNLVAVRVLNPTNEPIDGIALNETPHRNKTVPIFAGASFNHGGIMDSVELIVAPAVRVADLVAHPDPGTGTVNVRVLLVNTLAKAASCALRVSIAPSPSGETLEEFRGERVVDAGETWVSVQLKIDHPHLWQLNDPFLYRVTAEVSCATCSAASEYSVRCGFRDFRFENGYFRLNGTRVFLRGSHTGNHAPIGQQLPPDPDMFRRDLLYVKSMGFNMIRFIAGVATRYQLNLCDEIGLLVYEESYAGWLLGDSPRMKRLFDQSVCEMIRRDINHPSIVIWGLLNETNDGPVFQHARNSLPAIRAIDPDRVILLNSGRWDGQQSIGSLANPGSTEWECCLGGEAPGAAVTASTWGGYFERAGDAHAYPRVPHTAETISFLRRLGQDTGPVLLTEYGIGSAVDLWRVVRLFEQWRAEKCEDAVFYRDLLEQFLTDWRRWRLEEMFPRPSDYFAACVRKMAGQRLLGLNAIRSNPHIIGHSMTGTVDQGLTGEGLFTTFRELKPGTVDAVADGLAPLRWCLFAEPVHAYEGAPVRLEAVLADEDVLHTGAYPACFQVVDPSGARVFESHSSYCVHDKDSERPLAAPVFADEVRISGGPGAYRFVAEFESGAAAAGGEAIFYVSRKPDTPLRGMTVAVWGDDAGLENWLAARGAEVVVPHRDPADQRCPIVLSKTPVHQGTPGGFDDLTRRLQRGSTVICLDPRVFADGDDQTAFLPLDRKGRFHSIVGWLYLKDEWAKRHPIFDGMPAGGLLDYDFYREIIPDLLYSPGEESYEAVAGAIRASQGYSSGLMISIHRVGAGRLIINTFRIRENIGIHPAADMLLLNMLRVASRSDGDNHMPT